MAKKSAKRPKANRENTRRRNKRDGRWTVMVFMGAGTVPDQVSLHRHALDDIKEMESVSSGDGVNTFVQLHGDDVPQRGQITQKTKWVDVPANARDLRKGYALTQFIDWALRQARHRPDKDHSLLVLWGHAYQFGIGHTQTPTGIDALDFAELAGVFRSFHTEWKKEHPASDGKLDIVAFDACDLATIEMAYQLREFANYMLASQIGIPLPGWPYDQVLGRLANARDPMSPSDLGCYIVRRYCSKYHEDGQSVSLTLLDLRQAEHVFQVTQVLAARLAIAADGNDGARDRLNDVFHQSQTWQGKPFVDIADFCLNLSRRSRDPLVTQAAELLGDLLIRPKPVLSNGGPAPVGQPFIVEHGRNSHATAQLQGVSLYAPNIAEETHDWQSASYWYKKFVFANNTLWSSLVHALAQPR